METLLCLLAKDPAAAKNKSIKDACAAAVELLENEDQVGVTPKSEIRRITLTPLKSALDSRSAKLSGYAIDGLRKLVTDNRFISGQLEGESESQLTIQVLEVLNSSMNLPDDVLVAVMKFLLNFFNSEVFVVNEKSMCAIVELCVSVQKTTLLPGTKTAIRGALLQMISCVCYQLYDKKGESTASERIDISGVEDDIDENIRNLLPRGSGSQQLSRGMNLLRHDVIETLRYTAIKIEQVQEASSTGNNLLVNQKLGLCLDTLLTALKSLPPTINASPHFLEFIWQNLCPTLISMLGNPRNLKTLTTAHEGGDVSGSNLSVSDMGRGSGVSTMPPNLVGPNARNIYAISGELLRLVGCLSSMRPVLQSLFHRILLFPPPNYRLEALRAVNEFFQNPTRVLDICGPTILDARSNENRSRRDSDIDLLKLLMDGICESVYSCNVHVSSEAVSCIVSFLSTLAVISAGTGFQQFQVEEITKWADNLELMSPDELSLKTKKFVRFSKELVQKRTFHANNRADDDFQRELDRRDLEEEEIIAIEQIDRPYNPPSGVLSTHHDHDDSYEEVDISEVNGREARSEDRTPPRPCLKPAPAIGCLKLSDEQLTLAEEMRNSAALQSLGHGPGAGTGLAEADSDEEEIKTQSEPTQLPPAASSPRKLKDIAQGALPPATSGVPEKTGLNKIEESGDEASSQGQQSQKVFDITEDPDSTYTVSKTLPDIESERQALERRVEVERLAQEKVEEERQCANDYVHSLIRELPPLLRMHDTAHVDQALLKFASDFCAEVAEQKRQQQQQTYSSANGDYRRPPAAEGSASSPGALNTSMLILNADGVYIATYYTLLLNLKLIGSRYYENNGGRLPLTQKQFIEEIHESGVLVYLSSTWLSELYKLIISCNILGEGGYSTSDSRVNNALVLMLTDIDGMGNLELGGMMLHSSPKTNASLKKKIQDATHNPAALNAGLKFCRRILLAIWDTVLDVLAQPLRSKTLSGVTSIAMLIVEGTKEVTQRDREAICLSLDGLRSAAQLSCSLGVPSLCSSVFLLVTNASCVTDTEGRGGKGRAEGGKSTLPNKLHASHVLSMEALLSVGLEIGSHCTDCWKSLFKCATYVSQLEHAFFGRGGGGKGSHPPSTAAATPMFGKVRPVSDAPPAADSALAGEEDCPPPPPPIVPLATGEPINVVDVISQARVEVGLEKSNLIGGGILNHENAARVICGLSAEVDRMFEEAAVHLNLSSLLHFLRELRFASQLQLFSKLSSSAAGDQCNIAIPTMSSRSISTSGKNCSTSLHLFRMGEIILKCIRQRRPTLHVMRAWSIVAPHFVEAACHKDSEVSKKAVSSIHDILTEILNNTPEHAHFNFHEALFKPFESMLRLELCDDDVQDQVICSICELVEGCQENIKSGWRPLFGSLRAVRVQKHSNEECQVQLPSGRIDPALSPVFDVFDAFLNTDNVYVFANAAIDCILCLLKFVRGAGDFDPFEEDGGGSDGDADSTVTERTGGGQSAELCLPALERLLHCSNILASIYRMPLKPMFRGSRSVKLTSRLSLDPEDDNPQQLVGRVTQTVNVVYGVFMPSDLEQMDDETGIVRVWYLLLEGLTGAVTTCPRQYQPQTLGLLFELLKSVTQVPGPEFAVFAVTHLLLPMLHSWLRRGACVRGFWDGGSTVANFRHATGLSTDLVVEHITNFVEKDIPLTHVPLMLSQLLDLLVECVGQPNESVARLGCSCMKHLLVSAGPYFTDQMWTIACNGLRQAVNISMCFAKKLMENFKPGSIDFNGDIGQVKVAARRDCSELECERLQQLARQVFLLDSQFAVAAANQAGRLEPDLDETRSFIFIIYPPETQDAASSTGTTIRVPFRSIVVGLVSHQLLLQTLGVLLLSGAKSHASDAEHNLLPQNDDTSSTQNHKQQQDTVLLDRLTTKQVNVLLECLLDSYKMATEFDVRPGLKFLIQKVAKLDVAANLYRQVGASFTFYAHILIELCMRSPEKVPQNLIKATLRLEPLLNYIPGAPPSDVAAASAETANDGIEGEERKEILEKFKRMAAAPTEQQELAAGPELTFEPEEPEENLPAVGDLPIVEKSSQVQPGGLEWVVKRMYAIFSEIASTYVQMHLDRQGDLDLERISAQPLFLLIPDENSPAKRVSTERRFMFSKDMTHVGPNGDEEEPLEIRPPTEKEAEDLPPPPPTPKPARLAAFSDYDSKMYTVATNKTIKNLMKEYKKRKVQHSRSVFVRKPLQEKRSSTPDGDRKLSEESLQKLEITSQQQTSIIRDSDAKIQAWTEMICGMIQLVQVLPDGLFKDLLPVTFPVVNELTCHVTNPMVRQAVFDYMGRISRIYHFAST